MAQIVTWISAGMDLNSIVQRHVASVRQMDMFANISPADSANIVANARERHFGRRQALFVEGDPARHVFLLLSGCLKISQVGTSGQEVILRLNGPGDVLGAIGTASENNREARALQPTVALLWDRREFQSHMDRYPALRANIAIVLERQLNDLDIRFREVSTQKVGSRLSSELARLSRQMGKNVGGQVEIGLSRRELAQLTGTTLFTVSRLLSQWEAQGLLSARREAVLLRDLRGLLELSSEE
jgi:CRP/FNR family transcriptional regulator, nitrogen oxide reductase regulator